MSGVALAAADAAHVDNAAIPLPDRDFEAVAAATRDERRRGRGKSMRLMSLNPRLRSRLSPSLHETRLAVAIFVGLKLIQFLIGSYLEPLLIGTSLAILRFVVIFSVFFWSFMWGVPGAFIGIPILIAFIAYCEKAPGGRIAFGQVFRQS